MATVGKRPVALICALTLATSACAPTGEAEPDPKISGAYRISDADAWWSEFDDPRLSRLIRKALREAPDAAAARARLRQAEARARSVEAGLWPSLTAGAGASLSDSEGASESTRSYEADITATYEIDLWGRIDAKAEAARADTLASRRATEAAFLDISGEVADAWHELVARRALLRIAKRRLKVQADLTDIVEARVRNGRAPVSSLNAQRSAEGEVREAVAQAERDRSLAHVKLAALLGVSAASFAAPSGDALPGAPTFPSGGVDVRDLRQRPDVEEALARLRAADARVEAAVAERYPRIDITASLRDAAAAPANLFSAWAADLAADLALPLFDAGRRAAEVDRAEAVVAERFADYRKVMAGAIRDVEEALARGEAAKKKLASLRDREGDVRDRARGVRARYANGAAEYSELADAMAAVRRIEERAVSARLEALGARVALSRAVAGEVGERAGIEFGDAR